MFLSVYIFTFLLFFSFYLCTRCTIFITIIIILLILMAPTAVGTWKQGALGAVGVRDGLQSLAYSGRRHIVSPRAQLVKIVLGVIFRCR